MAAANDDRQATEDASLQRRLSKRLERRFDGVAAEREEIERWLTGRGGIVMLLLAASVVVVFLLIAFGLHL